MDIGVLKRLVVYGSPVAKAVALTLLDERTNGELIKKLQELTKKFEKEGDNRDRFKARK